MHQEQIDFIHTRISYLNDRLLASETKSNELEILVSELKTEIETLKKTKQLTNTTHDKNRFPTP